MCLTQRLLKRISIIMINNLTTSILPIVRNDQTLLSAEGVKNNLIFCIKQTGNNTGISTLMSVCYINTLLIETMCRLLFRCPYKIMYLLACTCICADLDNIYLYLFNY